MTQKVIFTLPAEVAGEATSGLLLGEFNSWNYNDGIKLKKQIDGSMKATALLEAGKKYEYRYLLNDGRWVNDHSADHYVHISGLHVENCVVNVAGEPKKTPFKEKKTTEQAPEKVKAATKQPAAIKEKTDTINADVPKTKTVKTKKTSTKNTGTEM